MKVTHTLALATALIFSGSVFGQVNFIVVEKIVQHVQTGADTTMLQQFIPPPGGVGPPISAPYVFRVDVEGTNISGISQPTFSIPGGSYSFVPDGEQNGKIFPAGSNEWSRSFYFAGKYTATGGPGGGPNGLDGVFNNGTYTVTAGGDSFEVKLGGTEDADAYSNTPWLIVSQGTWDVGPNGSRLLVDPTQALTITTNQFLNYSTNGHLNHIGLYVNHQGGDILELASFSDNSNFDYAANTDTLEHTFLAGTFTAGEEYFVDLEFNVITAVNTEIEGVMAIALFTQRTQFAIQAIPEPSTYAAIFGGVALVGVMIVRRRRAMVA